MVATDYRGEQRDVGPLGATAAGTSRSGAHAARERPSMVPREFDEFEVPKYLRRS